MTEPSNLRDAAEVAVTDADWKAAAGFGCGFCPDDMDLALAEAFARHRAAVEAEVVAEIVAWMRGNCMSGKWRVLASEIEEKWGKP